MRKKHFLLFSLMASSLILASCGGTSSISSSTSLGISTSSPSSPVTSTPTPSTNVTSSPSSSISSLTIDEKIHSAAKALAESTSFSINYNYDGEDFTDIYNIEKEYIYIDYDQSGYITLPFKDEKQIYAYSVDNNSITLEGRPENETGYAAFDDLLYGLPALLTKISSASLTGADYIQSNSEADVLVIAELLGFGSYAEEYYFYGVQFTVDDENNLVASLVLDSDFAGSFEEEWLTVTFTNLNDSTYALAENYLSSYQEPEETLSAEQFAYLTSDTFTVEATVTENYSMADLYELTLSKNASALETALKSDGTEIGTFITKGEDDKAYSNSISAVDGQLKSVSLNYDFADIETLKDIVNIDDFAGYSKEENTFHYFGDNLDEVASSLTGYDLASLIGLPIKNLSLTFGTSISFTIEMMTGYDSYGNIYDFSVEGTLVNTSTVDGIPEVNQNASQFKETYIDNKLDGTASVKMTIEENTEKPMYTSVITYNPGVILYQVSDNSTSPIQVEYYGKYQITDTQIQDFTLTVNGANYVATGVGNTYDGVLADQVNLFGIAPEVLTETSENTYGLISGVSDIDKVLPSTDRSHGNAATEVGFEVKTDDTHITSVSYVSTGFLSYAETITYDYENATISPTIIDALKTLQVNDSMLTWADCGVASTYETLVSFYGEKIAATIPYLHDNALTGNWYASTFTEGEINVYSFNWDLTEEQWSTYVEKFVALLEENGYVEMAEGTEQYAGLDTYINEENGVIISIGSDSFDGMYFYKA